MLNLRTIIRHLNSKDLTGESVPAEKRKNANQKSAKLIEDAKRKIKEALN